MRIISVTGGKGGIGKTTISVNMAIAFAKKNKKVLLLDADLGLANVDVMLGLQPKKTLHEVMLGQCSLQDICLTGPHGIKVIPAASGIQKMAELSSAEYIELIHSFSSLAENIDVMIVDMASGITSQVIDFTNAAQDIVMVVCNDPASLMDTYAVMKILHNKYGRHRFGVIINKVRNENEALEMFDNFQVAANQFINVNLNYLGCIPQDDYINLAARERVSVVDKYPRSAAVGAINTICESILHWNDPALESGIQFFFERLVLNHS